MKISKNSVRNELPMANLVGIDTPYVKKISKLFQKNQKRAPKRPNIKNHKCIPMLIVVGFNTSFVKKIKNFPKRVPKNKKIHSFLMKNVNLGFLMAVH